MNAFVGVSKALLTADKLKGLLEKYASNPTYYFLRWPHKVSEIESELPSEFPSPEGQMFNCDHEIRWKQKGDQFTVLLLSLTGDEPGFESVGQEWETEDQSAHFYPPTETRFPQGIPATSNIKKIAQRYFKDKQTATVHFIALTVPKSHDE